ncbi:hypothetical protein [Robbsia andropogonis]|uniref:hypothetical protein n=1 Tax=Robbsia andropogonis TaxID=28092 RepID=UPI0020A19E74|nr:hypothetical protein [Robbsia andropogonis]MCP1120992.1 hypothetical protein [Robbsia andropogonis]MCP1130827.1 hypothetical protein [Robbsia andropogonis]
MTDKAVVSQDSVCLDANQIKWGTFLREQFRAIDRLHPGRTQTLAIIHKKAVMMKNSGALNDLSSDKIVAKALDESQFTARAYREISGWPEGLVSFFSTPTRFSIRLTYDIKKLIKKNGMDKVIEISNVLLPSIRPEIPCDTRLHLLAESLALNAPLLKNNKVIKRHEEFVISFNPKMNTIFLHPTDPLKAEFFAERTFEILSDLMDPRKQKAAFPR